MSPLIPEADIVRYRVPGRVTGCDSYVEVRYFRPVPLFTPTVGDIRENGSSSTSSSVTLDGRKIRDPARLAQRAKSVPNPKSLKWKRP